MNALILTFLDSMAKSRWRPKKKKKISFHLAVLTLIYKAKYQD